MCFNMGMITPELQTYIQQQVGAGITKDVIKQNLSSKGWNMQDVDDAFFVIENEKFAQTAPPLAASTSHKGLWATVIVIIVLLLGAGGAYAAYQYGLFASPTPTPTTTIIPVATTTESVLPVVSTTSALATTTATCDNYQCLITAAAQCQPTTAAISYSGMPFPLNSDMSASGETQYEIKKSSDANSCVLSFSSISASLSISDKGRKTALASGMTETQITAQLQTMNGSLQSIAGQKTTCLSSTTTISAYLADMQKGNSKIEVSSNGQTTYTTSSGQKLVCTSSQ